MQVKKRKVNIEVSRIQVSSFKNSVLEQQVRYMNRTQKGIDAYLAAKSSSFKVKERMIRRRMVIGVKGVCCAQKLLEEKDLTLHARARG